VEKLTERNEGPTQKPAQLLNHLSEHPQKQMSVSWQSTVETWVWTTIHASVKESRWGILAPGREEKQEDIEEREKGSFTILGLLLPKPQAAQGREMPFSQGKKWNEHLTSLQIPAWATPVKPSTSPAPMAPAPERPLQPQASGPTQHQANPIAPNSRPC
jgi:hypothetical protein